jgi:single-strand DNA-binding protein
MASLNKIQIIGGLGRDPEVRTTPSGQKVASFSVAINEKFKDKNGQPQEKVEWVNVVCWRKQAEIAEKYLRKGSQVYVEGKLQTQSWDDPNGQKRYKTEVVVSNFQMLGNKGQNQQAPNRQEAENTNQMAQDDSFGNVPTYQEDTLHF